jgi:hypothetical protein
MNNPPKSISGDTVSGGEKLTDPIKQTLELSGPLLGSVQWS